MNEVNSERVRMATFFNIVIDYENKQKAFNGAFYQVICDEPIDPDDPSLKFNAEMYIRDLKQANPYFQLFNWVKGEIFDIMAIQAAINRVNDLNVVLGKNRRIEAN